MATLIDALAKTISLLVEIAISGTNAAFEKAKPTARVYLKSLLITTLVWLLLIPFLVILKAVTGWAVFGYLAAFLAIILTAALGLLYTPLGLVIGMLAGRTVNPAEAGERYLKFIASVIFAVLMGSLYLVRVPWERNWSIAPPPVDTKLNLSKSPRREMQATVSPPPTIVWAGAAETARAASSVAPINPSSYCPRGPFQRTKRALAAARRLY